MTKGYFNITSGLDGVWESGLIGRGVGPLLVGGLSGFLGLAGAGVGAVGLGGGGGLGSPGLAVLLLGGLGRLRSAFDRLVFAVFPGRRDGRSLGLSG